ncbi:MAG TPA: DUF3300 domain-containing protein, partial [Methylomirabilota bacterium]|nr:DUF3300 domain-containing protein [Methylomirabilota bacterium]
MTDRARLRGVIATFVACVLSASVAAQPRVGDGSVQCGGVDPIVPGDSLSQVAGRAYGDAMLYEVILDANWDALGGDAERLKVGMSLAIPCVDASGTIPPAEEVVEAGALLPLTADELEVLVARIALYPDELVALIASASLYPLDVVEAARFLAKYETDKTLEPRDSWDGSIISLLNYPEIVGMMSDDLDWTQAFGDALAYQQKEVLVAIQQLRDEAVTGGVIKTDEKVTVVEENDNIVIQSASPEVIYVPQYEPAMLYEPGYVAQPIAYYPDPYPSYYAPTATFFAGAVTGAIFASAVDWDDWGVWGGDFDGDIDFDCNNCFNDREFNGRINANDVDWRNVDRSKMNIDRNSVNNFERNDVTANLKQNNVNNIKNKNAKVRN